MKKKLAILILLITASPLYSFDFVIMPYTYRNMHLLISEYNSYAETIDGYGLEVSYNLFSFLMVSAFGETGSLKAVKKKVELHHDLDFPNKASRSLKTLGGKLEFYFHTNPENIFYFGLGYRRNWLSALTDTDTKMIYPESEKTYNAYSFVFGDRFLLFPAVMFNLEADFSFPFSKVKAPMNKDSIDFSDYMIQIRLGIGFML